MIKITEFKLLAYILNFVAFISIFLYYFMHVIEESAYLLIFEYNRVDYFTGVNILGTLAFYNLMLIVFITICVDCWMFYLDYKEQRKAYL